MDRSGMLTPPRNLAATEFAFPQFIAPLWLRAGHVQTIAGAFWPYSRPQSTTRRRLVRLVDGDQLVLHDDCPGASTATELERPVRSLEALERRVTQGSVAKSSPNDGDRAWQTGDPVAILLHGLAGSHASGYMVRTAALLNRMGVRVFRMDQRGCGAGEELARYPGHAGRSDDAAAVLTCVRKLCPGSSIVLAGYSLGANIALKLVGEMGDDATEAIDSLVAIAPPFDLDVCCRTLARGLGRLYDRNFLGNLRRQFAKRRGVSERFPPPDPWPRTLIEFDDRYTAPLSGFANVADYYEQSSAKHVIGAIRVPTWVVSADDDPMVPRRLFDAHAWPAEVRVTITRGGGHLGHIARGGVDPTRRWLDWRVAQWVGWRFGLPVPRTP